MSFMRILSRSPETEFKMQEPKARRTNFVRLPSGASVFSAGAWVFSSVSDEEVSFSFSFSLFPMNLNFSARRPKATRARPSIWFHRRTS